MIGDRNKIKRMLFKAAARSRGQSSVSNTTRRTSKIRPENQVLSSLRNQQYLQLLCICSI